MHVNKCLMHIIRVYLLYADKLRYYTTLESLHFPCTAASGAYDLALTVTITTRTLVDVCMHEFLSLSMAGWALYGALTAALRTQSH